MSLSQNNDKGDGDVPEVEDEAFYDNLFRDRYTEKDLEYVKTPAHTTPPIVPNWAQPPRQHYNNQQRGNYNHNNPRQYYDHNQSRQNYQHNQSRPGYDHNQQNSNWQQTRPQHAYSQQCTNNSNYNQNRGHTQQQNYSQQNNNDNSNYNRNWNDNRYRQDGQDRKPKKRPHDESYETQNKRTK